MRNRRPLLLGLASILLLPGVTPPATASLAPSAEVTPAAAAPAHGQAGRIAIWSGSLRGRNGTSPDTTVRNIARASVDATSLRIRIGNPYGDRALHLRAGSIGLQARIGEADLVPGSLRKLTFAGKRSITLDPGESAYSDPVALRVRAQQNVAISLYAPGAPINDQVFPPPTPNPPGSFLSLAGDHTGEPGDKAYPETNVGQNTSPGYHPGQFWWSDIVDARSAARGTIVALGDSNTSGHQAIGGGDRWTDLLARELNERAPGRQLAVANAGISGNTVSRQPNPYDPTGQCCGPPAVDRLHRDVFSVAGAKYVILFEGTNDLGGGASAPQAPASRVIAALREVADRSHARGLKVIGATLMPMCNDAGSFRETNRLAVNEFIRTSRIFDGLIDFDAAVRDPANPREIRPAFMADCYHPNAAGHAAMAAAIDTGLFR
ncbi:GDSL-type esterase/lipase family protein [Kribbella deserti]|uniref:GDSL-type esterase/lipase family protein n=1 Tax=Kribbella deserti TaxID=1926257 RepID=A0ABV6QVR2_9ACTN